MELTKEKNKSISLKKAKIQTAKRKTSDEIWDTLLQTQESKLLLDLMGEEALKEFKEGKAENGGWSD